MVTLRLTVDTCTKVPDRTHDRGTKANVVKYDWRGICVRKSRYLVFEIQRAGVELIMQ